MRAQEAEEARFTDFNQGDEYLQEEPQQYNRPQQEQRQADHIAPTNRGDERVVKKQGNDSEEEDWGNDVDQMLPD